MMWSQNRILNIKPGFKLFDRHVIFIDDVLNDIYIYIVDTSKLRVIYVYIFLYIFSVEVVNYYFLIGPI